jgi:HD-GYP domain-containing protein (c-di-GMP phosphodiesterase class II)
MDPYQQTLIDATTATASQLGVNDWDRLMEMLEPLREHAPDMFNHSMRVGLTSCGLAQMEGRDAKLGLHGGCAHDLGKCKIDPCVLYAKQFGEVERAAMTIHPRIGYEMLKSTNLFSAFIAGLHHQFQDPPYGIDLKVEAPWLSSPTHRIVMDMAELVATADFFDALTTRADDYGQLKSPDEVQRVMEKRFGDQGQRIDWLTAHAVQWRP